MLWWSCPTIGGVGRRRKRWWIVGEVEVLNPTRECQSKSGLLAGGGGFKYFLFSPRKLGKIPNFDLYFSDELKPPTRLGLLGCVFWVILYPLDHGIHHHQFGQNYW